MKIFPAIDLKDNKVVRLHQGDYDAVTVYSDHPAEIAAEFSRKGAENLHVVDLDGARDGELSNFAAVSTIVRQGGLFVQVGGGIRDESRIRKYLELGVGRVILGTVAVEDFAFLERMVRTYGEKIAVGVDARDEKIAVRGWLETTAVDSVEFCKKLAAAGVKTIIYTDIAKDGAMGGTNLAVYERLKREVNCDIIASGGVSALSDISALKAMGTYGAIVGKALYQGALTLEEVLLQC